jgi:hypothetical protein
MKAISFLFTLCLLLSGLCLTSVSEVSTATDAITFLHSTADAFGDNTCTVTVKNRYGGKAASIKVSTDVSGGISCSGGRSFYTDSDGEVTLKWVSGCKLNKIYVDGRGYEVSYSDGGNYTVTMK